MALMLGSTQINSLEVFKRGQTTQETWTPPEDWPDIRKMLADDNGHGYTYVAYALYAIDLYPSIDLNYTYWRTSDGHEYRGNATHVWDHPEERYGWVAMYSNTPFTYNKSESTYSQTFKLLWICFNFNVRNMFAGEAIFVQAIECSDTLSYSGSSTLTLFNSHLNLQKIPDNIDLSEWSNCSRMFSNCYMLSSVPKRLNMQICTNTSYMFANCYHLKDMPEYMNLPIVTSTAYMFNCCFVMQHCPKGICLDNVTNATNMFYTCYQLKEVPDEIVMPECTTCQYMFFSCQNIHKLPSRIILDKCTSCLGMFSTDYAAQIGPTEIYLPKCTNCSSMFAYCISLKNLPDVFDISKSTNNNSIFQQCFSLENVPTHLTANASVSFQQSANVSKESVATFDASGNINGGMIYNLNTCSASGQTITFHANTKAKFTSDEWTKIKTMLSSKNWGCSPA